MILNARERLALLNDALPNIEKLKETIRDEGRLGEYFSVRDSLEELVTAEESTLEETATTALRSIQEGFNDIPHDYFKFVQFQILDNHTKRMMEAGIAVPENGTDQLGDLANEFTPDHVSEVTVDHHLNQLEFLIERMSEAAKRQGAIFDEPRQPNGEVSPRLITEFDQLVAKKIGWHSRAYQHFDLIGEEMEEWRDREGQIPDDISSRLEELTKRFLNRHSSESR